MATDEEINRFVSENRELVERIMESQRESIDFAADMGRDAISTAFKSTFIMADYMRQRTELFIDTVLSTITDPEIQNHFMNAGMEVMTGLTSIVQKAPLPSDMREAAIDLNKNMRMAACRANKDCPVKAERKAKEIIEEQC